MDVCGTPPRRFSRPARLRVRPLVLICIPPRVRFIEMNLTDSPTFGSPNCADTPPPPLGLYVHVPFCASACPYCDFYKMPLPETAPGDLAEYASLACAELALLLDAHPAARDRQLASIYIGGGTPSVLAPEFIAAILAETARAPGWADECEVTIEANPDTASPETFAAWRAAGANRLSLGCQSFDDAVLERLGRRHDAATARLAIEWARKAGFGNLSLDFIFGAPDQTLDSWMATLREAVALGPEHISFYGLTLHEGTPFFALECEGRLCAPGEDLQAEQYVAGRRLLVEAGYDHYEISNFARPGRRARHNENYWLGADWLALGPAAHASFDGLRWENPRSWAQWAAAIRAGHLARAKPCSLSPEEQWIEAIFLGLRRAEGLDANSLARRFGRDLRIERAREIERLLAAGLAEWRHRAPAHSQASAGTSCLALTERGLLLADSVMRELI